jgi:hypothetical protein
VTMISLSFMLALYVFYRRKGGGGAVDWFRSMWK